MSMISFPPPSSPPSGDLAPRARSRGSHPLVVTLDKRSAPRAAFSGDRLIEITSKYILIEKQDGRRTRQRFWRH